MNLLTTTGRLTKDMVLRFTANGDPVGGFTVATDVGYGDKKHAVFIDCSLWGKRAEALDPYLKKGTAVTVSGEADLRIWESNGKNGANITCKVNDVVLQGSKSDSAPAQNQGFRNSPPADDKSTPQPGGFDSDDIPFN